MRQGVQDENNGIWTSGGGNGAPHKQASKLSVAKMYDLGFARLFSCQHTITLIVIIIATSTNCQLFRTLIPPQ